MSYDNDKHWAASRWADEAIVGLYLPPAKQEIVRIAIYEAFAEGAEWVTSRMKDNIMAKMFGGDDD